MHPSITPIEIGSIPRPAISCLFTLFLLDCPHFITAMPMVALWPAKPWSLFMAKLLSNFHPHHVLHNACGLHFFSFQENQMDCIPNSIKIIGSLTIPRTSSDTNNNQIPIDNKSSRPTVFQLICFLTLKNSRISINCNIHTGKFLKSLGLWPHRSSGSGGGPFKMWQKSSRWSCHIVSPLLVNCVLAH